ncbi:MAG: DNA-binding protein [Proteobacteria bacterium]|nr:MAG: DNA-binding protein [Pseudomonadota bacterium]
MMFPYKRNMTRNNTDFIKKIVTDILSGVRDGLGTFSGSSKVAVIYQLDVDSELYICDPHNLLRGHESKIQSTYFDNRRKPLSTGNNLLGKPYSHIETGENLTLDGVISFAAQSGPVHHQMWLTEHHPEMLSTGPTERWLEHAVLRFSHDTANGPELYTGISGMFLREYATHAVHGQIIHEYARLGVHQKRLDIYPILRAIIGISKTKEEQQSPYGELVFITPSQLESIDFLARFRNSEQPLIDNYKHVRKLLLAVQNFNYKLISDGQGVLGVARGTIDGFHLAADFRGFFGFLKMNNQPLCSFADGTYSSSSHQAKLFEIEEILLDYKLDSTIRSRLFHIVSSLVHYAETCYFGCTIVVDMNEPLTTISGQNLAQPLDLERSNLLDLACDLARVDGALQIGKDRRLHRFACLLDGAGIKGEDRSRGARYNSALRFTAQHHDTIIVVVSADRPVSVIYHGLEHRGACHSITGNKYMMEPQLLTDWLGMSRVSESE